MAKFNANEADNYGGQGNGSFFALKNDKDTARIRFLYNTIEDIEGLSVHEVEIDGKKRYVNCLREYNEPVENCPLCEARYKVIAKLFVILQDMDTEEIKVWDRGKTFFTKMSSLCAHYAPLIQNVFDVERNGKPNNPKTTYETYWVEDDGTTFEDIPELPQILGGLVLDKTFEELNFFLDNGYFEEVNEEPAQQQAPSRNPGRDNRRPAGNSSANKAGNSSAQPQRRTPASNNNPAPNRGAAAPGRGSASPGTNRRNGTDKF